MIIVSSQNTGLNKSFLKKIRLRSISIKNAIKVTKALAPIALSVIPIAGGTASKIGDKLLNSRVGRIATKLKKSKVGTAVQKFAKTDLAKSAFSNIKASAMNGQGEMPKNYTDHSEPVGEATPVKLVTSDPTAKKDNTMLYVGGAVALGTIGYFATRKK